MMEIAVVPPALDGERVDRVVAMLSEANEIAAPLGHVVDRENGDPLQITGALDFAE